MRQIGNLPNEEQAQTLADYLLSLQIETRLEKEADGAWAIWVCDEDRLSRARDELADFRASPTAARFLEGAEAERARRRARPAREVQEQPAETAEPARGLQPATAAIVLLSIAVGFYALLQTGGSGRLTRIPSELMLSPRNDPTLPEIRSGQLWRLVSPALVHFTLAHWFFDVLWLYLLGNQVEARRGLLRYVGLLLICAVVSNLAQFYLGQVVVSEGTLIFILSSHFGGLSGVVYGLFGYVWIKGRFDPDLEIAISNSQAGLLLAWLVFCFTSLAETLIGPVANAAHVAGLLTGIAVSATPLLWRRLRIR